MYYDIACEVEMCSRKQVSIVSQEASNAVNMKKVHSYLLFELFEILLHTILFSNGLTESPQALLVLDGT